MFLTSGVWLIQTATGTDLGVGGVGWGRNREGEGWGRRGGGGGRGDEGRSLV